MLAYALAIAVGLSGLVLFSTAFFMSDIHRRDDFFWSAISLFYAIVLWFCATRITGGVLLGQAAAVALLVSYNWQTLKLRKAIAYPDKAAELNNFSILAAASQLLNRGKSKPQPKVARTPPKVTEQEIAIPDTTSAETLATAIADKKSPETDKTSQEAKKTGFFAKFLGGKKQQSSSTDTKPTKNKTDTSSVANTKLNDILDDAVVVETSTPLASLKDTKTQENTETSESVAQQPTTATETQTSEERNTTPELNNVVETETASTSEFSSTETIDTTQTETSDSNTTEISVTETVTMNSSDDGEESVVEAVVIETSESESETMETTTPESLESKATLDVDKFLDELDSPNDKPSNS